MDAGLFFLLSVGLELRHECNGTAPSRFLRAAVDDRLSAAERTSKPGGSSAQAARSKPVYPWRVVSLSPSTEPPRERARAQHGFSIQSPRLPLNRLI